MIKRTIPVIAAMLGLAALAPLAQGATATHKLKLTIKDVTINANGDRPSDTQTTAGLVAGDPFGRAVESVNNKVTSASSSGVTLEGTLTIYTTHGTMTAAIQTKVTPTSTGGATGTGSGTITGGTGSYNHAGGSFTFRGAEHPNSPLFIVHAVGTAAF